MGGACKVLFKISEEFQPPVGEAGIIQTIEEVTDLE